MLRSAWVLGAGSLLTLWYAGRVLLFSFDRADRASAIESMTRAGLQIKERSLNMVFFPEGTRCPDGVLHPIQERPVRDGD